MPKKFGKCHLCGKVGELSFEHVPPRKAFNEKPVVKAKFDEVLGLGPDAQIKGPVQQRGMGDYTLCLKCNNDTGSWYGRSFVDWCYQGLEILLKTKEKAILENQGLKKGNRVVIIQARNIKSKVLKIKTLLELVNVLPRNSRSVRVRLREMAEEPVVHMTWHSE